MRFRAIGSMVLMAMIVPMSVGAQEGDVVGKWRTIDDKTGQPKSIVEIFKQGEEVKGKIVEVINPSEPNPVCKECEGEKKGKPIEGLEIIWSMKEQKAGKEWSGGRILDPANGKTYKASLKLKDSNTLDVRGYIGIPALGRTQTWHRATEITSSTTKTN